MKGTSRRRFIQGSGLIAGVLASSAEALQAAGQEVTVGNDRRAPFEVYSKRYQTVKMRREGGIIELQFHTNNGPLRWGGLPHAEFGSAFLDVGRDPDNGVVILTGTGDEWSGPQVGALQGRGAAAAANQAGRGQAPPPGRGAGPGPGGPGPGSGAAGAAPPAAAQTPGQAWDGTYWAGKALLTNLLNIEVPVISAINGPIYRHAEIPLMSDITVASDSTVIQDSAHFQGELVPGDGVHVIFPLLMGLNRGRYFLLTGQQVSATEAKEIGLVNEVVPKAEVLPRAWTLARELMKRPRLRRRYSRVLLTQDLKHRMNELLGYGLALEGLANGEK